MYRKHLISNKGIMNVVQGFMLKWLLIFEGAFLSSSLGKIIYGVKTKKHHGSPRKGNEHLNADIQSYRWLTD